MNDRKHRMNKAVPGLSMLATLAFVLTAWLGVATTVTAQGADSAELYSLHIRADNTDDGETTFGARFTVTTLDGEYLGACTLEGDENSPPWQYCWVDVPAGITVVVRQDPASIPAGYAPVENPIVFDTAYPTTTPHKIDVAFDNAPQSGSGDNGGNDSFVAALVAALVRILQMILGSPGR